MIAILLVMVVTITVSFEIFRKKAVRADLYSFFIFFLYLTYVIPIFLWYLDPYYDQWYSYYIPMTYEVVLVASITVFIVVISSMAGFYFGRNSNLNVHLPERALSPRKVKRFVTAYLAVYFSIYIVVIAYTGGLAQFMLLGLQSRGEGSYLGLAGYLRVFLTFGELALPFLLVALYFSRWPFAIKATFFVMVLLMVYSVSVSTGSRAAIIYPLIVLAFFSVLSVKRINIGVIFFSFAIFMFAVLSVNYIRVFYYGDLVSDVSGYSVGDIVRNDIYYMFSYFKHYLITIYSVYEYPTIYEFPRLGLDVLRAVVQAVPGIGKEDVDFLWLSSFPAEINKQFLGGIGYVPPGWIAYSLMSGGVVGLVIYTFLASVLGGLIDRSLCCFSMSRPAAAAHRVFLFFVWYRVFFAQDPWQVITASFGIYLLLMIWYFSFFIRVTRKTATSRAF